MLLGKTGEGRVDILVGATIQNNKPLSEAVRRLRFAAAAVMPFFGQRPAGCVPRSL